MDQSEFEQSVRSEIMAPAITALRADTYLADRMEDAYAEDRARSAGGVIEREPRAMRPVRRLGDAEEMRRSDARERGADFRGAK